MFRKITSQKPDRFPKPVRFEAGNYLSCSNIEFYSFQCNAPDVVNNDKGPFFVCYTDTSFCSTIGFLALLFAM
jgi:hypothetical protein